ncbi:MAG: XRE family transcriptional regulator, partial [Erysipelotrichaceae bacterium]
EYSDDEMDSSIKRFSLSDATTYLKVRKRAAYKIAIATFMCILSPIPLLLLGGASEMNMWDISENIAGVLGLIPLLIIVTIAVAIFIMTGFENQPYAFLEEGPFNNEYGVKGMVSEAKKNYHPTYVRSNIIGTCLCILSPIPLFIGTFLNDEFLLVVMLCVLLFMVSIAVIFFITAGVRYASFQKVLKDDEYYVTDKKKHGLIEMISTAYWLIVVGIYLLISFVGNDWKTSWLVWPVSGVIYVAIVTVVGYFGKEK